ncbi:putative galactokinase [Necator americanus]|uniref:Putative galactokinase n=1 Tax=Necator americanus TaxID=51031 RepID=W2TL45_NECAM|nr:putative galactokinase [Necator americanus]ETN81866.1 putative galactokinase [Necator americanus]
MANGMEFGEVDLTSGCILGEHIDYHGYGVFPIATEEGTETLAAPNGKGIIRIANVNEQYPFVLFSLLLNVVLSPRDEHTVSLPFEWSGASPPKWYDYVLCGWKGVMERLNCDQIGFDLLVEGSIPPSSGLSSSSSLVCSAALTAWMIHTKETFESIRKEDLADLCAIAEHYVGTHGGGMDQAAEVLAVKGSALRIDFFPLKSRVISLPPLASFVVLHCGEALNKAATSHYNERVSEGRLAGKLLLKNHGTGTNPRSWRLKDVQEALGKTLEEMLELCECLPVEAPREQLEDLLTKEVVAECLTSNTQHLASFKLRPRARHVYSEALRVHLFEEACKAGDLIEMGKLMYASHESCSKDYECSCEAMDTLVSECQRAGAIGCRLTGAGWGGCAVALVDNSNPKDLGHKVLFYSKPSAGISGQFL